MLSPITGTRAKRLRRALSSIALVILLAACQGKPNLVRPSVPPGNPPPTSSVLTPTLNLLDQAPTSLIPTNMLATDTPTQAPAPSETSRVPHSDPVAQKLFPGARVAAWSPAGDIIAIRTDAGLDLIKASNLELIRSIPMDAGEKRLLAVDAEGRRVAVVGSGATIYVWDLETGAELASADGYINGIAYMAFAGDGTLYVADIFSGGNVGVFGLSETLEPIEDGARAYLEQFDFSHQPIAVNPASAMIAATGLAGGLNIYRPEHPDAIPTLSIETPGIAEMQFSDDGSSLVTLGQDCMFRIFDPVTGDKNSEFSGCADLPKSSSLHDLIISQDTRSAAAATDKGTLGIWDLETGKETAQVVTSQTRIISLSFNPDGTQLASLSEDGWLQIWDFDR